MKIRVKKPLKESKISDSLAKTMEKYGIEPGKQLGKGQFGTVFYGISDEYGPVAIKMLQSKIPSTQREVENYQTVNSARAKSKYIAKHFPEVYFIDDKSDPNYAFIVMELLDIQEGYQQETINILFGGINTALAPYEDEKEVSGTFKDRSNRIYVLFKNKESQESIIQNIYNDFGPALDFLLPVVKEFLSNIDAYVKNIKSTDKAEKDISFMRLSNRAEEYLFNYADGELKQEFKAAPWLLTFIVKILTALKEEDKTGNLFSIHHEGIIRYWLEYIRKSSIIGLRDAEFGTRGMEDTGVDEEQWAAFKEASSIKKAISDLRDITKLDPRDMHDKNVMIRPQTGDIVIVDLGLFRKS
jgi:serine/threonine protein kinase